MYQSEKNVTSWCVVVWGWVSLIMESLLVAEDWLFSPFLMDYIHHSSELMAKLMAESQKFSKYP